VTAVYVKQSLGLACFAFQSVFYQGRVLFVCLIEKKREQNKLRSFGKTVGRERSFEKMVTG
jgi:hypothetical protein